MKRTLPVACLLAISISVPVRTASVPTPTPARPVPPPTDIFSRAISLFDGHPVAPSLFPPDVEGFESYLQAVGVRSIRAVDLTRPHHPAIAEHLGYKSFLPPHEWWPRGAALALLTERLRAAAGEQPAIRNWWRPAAYNADPMVGGARNGDHPTANALDLDYASVAARVRAERLLRSLQAQAPWLNLSLGLGAQSTHIGIGSPRGHREWHYAGWTPAR